MQRRGKCKAGKDVLPESFGSVEEAAEFWDEHDSMDYGDMLEEVSFQVDVKRRVHLVPVASNILASLREKARVQGVSTETLVNLLLQEHINRLEISTSGRT
ncbi:MAG: CopG family antitoxin [Thermodesulfobacteriota bacterium]